MRKNFFIDDDYKQRLEKVKNTAKQNIIVCRMFHNLNSFLNNAVSLSPFNFGFLFGISGYTN